MIQSSCGEGALRPLVGACGGGGGGGSGEGLGCWLWPPVRVGHLRRFDISTGQFTLKVEFCKEAWTVNLNVRDLAHLYAELRKRDQQVANLLHVPMYCFGNSRFGGDERILKSRIVEFIAKLTNLVDWTSFSPLRTLLSIISSKTYLRVCPGVSKFKSLCPLLHEASWDRG